MRIRHDPTFEAAVEAGLRACVLVHPDAPRETSEAADAPAAGVRPEVVERCKALIQDGIYETEDRLDAAVNRLAARIGSSAYAA